MTLRKLHICLEGSERISGDLKIYIYGTNNNNKKNPENNQQTAVGKGKTHVKCNMGYNYAVANIMRNRLIATG